MAKGGNSLQAVLNRAKADGEPKKAMDRAVVIASLVSLVPQALAQQPNLLVVADRRNFDAGELREFADADIHV